MLRKLLVFLSRPFLVLLMALRTSVRLREKKVQAAMSLWALGQAFAGRSLGLVQHQSVGLCTAGIREFGNLAALDGIVSAAREHEYNYID